MPGLDRTGPEGRGPMTGRRRGYCAGNENADFRMWPGHRIRRGRGYAGGRGMGHGPGWGYGYAWQEDFRDLSDKESIKNEINILKNQLSFLENKLSDLEKKEG